VTIAAQFQFYGRHSVLSPGERPLLSVMQCIPGPCFVAYVWTV
jgi:hypothetical protein